MTRLGQFELNQIYTGDARALAEGIPDNSVDLIFTDPPYPKEFLYLYGWVAKEGARILKPGGWLFAYGGTEYLPTYLEVMGNHLDYYWVFALLHNGGYPRMWHKKLLSGYKPVMVYTKGNPTINPWMSTVHSATMDKRFHEWGQGDGMALKVVEMLTPLDGVVFEPCVGGGTVPAVCKMLGRNYLAFEIDPATADKARERVFNTQPPLFVPEPIQFGLLVS